MSDSLMYQLDGVLEALTERLSPAARKKLAGTLAMGLRERQAKRIRQQRNPDGSPYVPKKKREIKTYTGRLRFIWKGEVREINNWHNTKDKSGGGVVTGFDASKGSFRSFRRDDIAQYLAIELNKTAMRRTLKKNEMFRRLRTYQYLRTEYSAQGARVGFTGRAAAIARIHQFGLVDDLDAHFHGRYPERELLGINDDDVHWMSDQILSFISGRS
ncbi:phage virion morphogenesis protein [Enterobacter sp. CGMCC 5087]|uniref:phage virion morphogenesis protein n=1 Tax=Enterobacter sp. CGMCC 5087 TaxID=2183878 RepID=UPI000D6828A0|nr:phage virion morphogenesis protein [Enterobacter sp. CGMCC 5087]PWI80492.1 phage virion morphogenesis protein [Enterobacter sp. CGMCC 5087]